MFVGILYIFSLSLQIAGAIILIIRYWSKSIDDQVKELQYKRNRVEKGTLILGEITPSNSEYKTKIILNRIAFIYIAIGYIVSIWSESVNKLIETVAIMGLTILLIAVGLVLSKRCIE